LCAFNSIWLIEDPLYAWRKHFLHHWRNRCHRFSFAVPGPLLERWHSLDFYLNDVWRVTNSFTVTLGLNWSIQTPPKGEDARQSVPVDASNNQRISANYVFNNRRAAAETGQVWNPLLTWKPIVAGEFDSVYSTQWSNLGPRVAASWNPAFSQGVLGKLFGDRKTVLTCFYL